jgi:hypothetical protein
MDIGAIFLILALALLVALFVTRPFMEQRSMTAVTAEEQELSALMAERDRLITALQELDFDHTLGKIPAEDYPPMRADLLQRAADILRKLDNLQPQQPAEEAAENRIEAVIAARRADAAVNKSAPEKALSDDDLEQLIATRKAGRKEKSGGFCPKCGKPVLHSDRFCPHCGKSIK